MSEWREDNFLERLSQRSQGDAGEDLCPLARTLYESASIDGPASISSEMIRHLKHCATCCDLYERILQFEQPSNSTSEAETSEALRRLDSWLKEFLRGETRKREIPDVPPDPMPSPRVSPPARDIATGLGRFFGRLQWGFAIAAATIVLVAGVYIYRSVVALTPAPQVARAISEPATPTSSETKSDQAQEPLKEVRPESAHGPSGPEATSKVASPRVAASTREPALQVASPSAVTSREDSPKDMPPQDAQSAVAVPTETLAPVDSSRRPLNAALRPPNQTSTPGTGRASTGTSLVTKATLGRSTLPGGAKSPVLSAQISSIRLAAGTRIWIVLETTTPSASGSFRFDGTLLLPVSTSASAVVLNKGTPVAGFGQTVGEKTLIHLTDLIRGGVHYKLRPSQGATAIETAGSGKTVKFENGKVAEMWLEFETVFDEEGPSTE